MILDEMLRASETDESVRGHAAVEPADFKERFCDNHHL